MAIYIPKPVPNRFQANFRTGLGQIGLESIWGFLLSSHDGQSDWNRFQNDLKVSCEQGDSVLTFQTHANAFGASAVTALFVLFTYICKSTNQYQ